jgi:WD40 repeat protein
VVASDPQGRVIRWQGPDFQQAETLFEIGANRYPGNDLLSPDGRLLAVTTTNNVLQVWDLSRQRLWREFPSPTGRIWAARFCDDDNKLVALAYDYKLLYEWDLNSGREIHSWRVPVDSKVIASSPDQRLCVVKGYLGGGYSGDVLFEDLVGGGSVKQDLDALDIWMGAFSPDGKLFAIASTMGYARVWDTATWREVATLRGYLKGVNCVAFSRDGKRLATGGTDEGLKLWDTESWQEVLTLGDQQSRFTERAFSSDGNAIIEQGAGIVHIWRAPSWEEINAAEKSAPAPSL